MTDTLAILFGSLARVKLLRLFLFNPRQSFTQSEVTSRARVTTSEARSEFTQLCKAGLLKRTVSRKGNSRTIRYTLNAEFEYLAALQSLLLNAPARGENIVERIKGFGTLKLVILGGVFIGDWDGRLDILVVGDRVQERRLKLAIDKLESEIGKELRYALLTTQDFYYRYNMSDKLVRDVMDYSHKIVLDRLNMGLK